ncbi:hypothetical protein [uncultured Tenacibaculum sp.]|uniref:hypothetical protein n=1 Tax=uncultured Tenacibaculum sp. TaxID=174713 RepID=UPI0026336962|nr:hypothetical protein [uncultured Tenacibaculum sp.]
MKAKIKIAAIVMIAMNFGVKAQNSFPSIGTVSIYETTDNQTIPKLSLGRRAGEALNFYVSDYVGIIKFKQDEPNHIHEMKFDIESPTINEMNYDFMFNKISKFRIKSNGKVGIGTTSPQDLLNLHNSNQTSNIGLKITRGNENHGLRLGVNNTHAFLWTTENQNLALATSNKERLTITSGGDVGIGTTSPSAKLDVGGELKTNWGRLVLRDNSLEEWYTNGPARLAVNYLGYQKGDSQFRDYTIYNGKRVGILHVSGEQESVGIGTATTGSHKLAVEGSIGAREVKVEANGWSDFVFEKEYKLPTLQEVENHIKTKGHLKDIPSANEVEKNGFFLGEMDSKLLQKIEELTLYTIEQEKSLKAQNSKINEQQKKIERLEMLVNKLLKGKK